MPTNQYKQHHKKKLEVSVKIKTKIDREAKKLKRSLS